MKNQDILTVLQITEIRDLNKLNTLIKQYERELNRRMRALTKYAESDKTLYQKAMKTFAGLTKTEGFYMVRIESPETNDYVIARARLLNLASVLRSGNTQIRTLRKNARIKRIEREHSLYDYLNKYAKNVTREDIKNLTSDDWKEIRRILNTGAWKAIDSGSKIQAYINKQKGIIEEINKTVLKDFARLREEQKEQWQEIEAEDW